MATDYPDHIFAHLTEKRQLQILQASLSRIDELMGLEPVCEANVFSEEEKANRYLKLISVSGLPKKIELIPQKMDRLLAEIERRLGVTLREDQFLYRVRDREHSIGGPNGDEKLPLKIILHNIRSAFNVGAIVRTAECLQAQEVELTGYTTDQNSESLKKTDMGALNSVNCRSGRDIFQAIEGDLALGRTVYAVETLEKAPSYDEIVFKPPTTLIFGNERFGLEEEVIEACSGVIRLPVYGVKNSLNVAATMAICSYEINRQWRNTNAN